MATYVFAWNPKLWGWPELPRDIARLRKRGHVDVEWSSGRARAIEPGSRAFFVRLGVEPKGVFGAGYTLTAPQSDIHWRKEKAALGTKTNYLTLRIEFLSETPLLDATCGAPKDVLDIGTGSGIHAVIAATRGCRVTAVDVESGPVGCARANAALNGVEDRMRVVQGDLFGPVEGKTFDVVLGSLPSFRGVPTTPFERAWKSPDIFERFAAGARAVLNPGGVVLCVITSHGDPHGHLAALAHQGFAIERLTWRHFGCETMAIYAARMLTAKEKPAR